MVAPKTQTHGAPESLTTWQSSSGVSHWVSVTSSESFAVPHGSPVFTSKPVDPLITSDPSGPEKNSIALTFRSSVPDSSTPKYLIQYAGLEAAVSEP